jgi:aldose 1-epimerase
MKTLAALALLVLSLANLHAAEGPPREVWGKTAEGESVEVFTLTNAHGLRARVMTWGAALVEMQVPDRDGKRAEVTLGFDALEQWLRPNPFFGCVAGRYANRIAKGRFTLDGHEYVLAINNGPNHLHGGLRGFDKRNWQAETAGPNAVRFTYVSADGEEGYPGRLTTRVTYTLGADDGLRLDYEAVTDKPTVLNLTNHTYWNLAGAGDVLAHELQIAATRHGVTDAGLIPTGELRAVASGALDFTKAKPLGRDIGETGGGYDHGYVLDAIRPAEPALAAVLRDPGSGRTMEVLTTEPCVQLYTGNHIKGVSGRSGQVYAKHAGVCLETQHFPDSPNQPAFPSTVLRPGETFRSTTIYRFSTR